MIRRIAVVGTLLGLGLMAGCRSTTSSRSGVTSIEPITAAKPGSTSEIVQASATSWPGVESGGQCSH